MLAVGAMLRKQHTMTRCRYRGILVRRRSKLASTNCLGSIIRTYHRILQKSSPKSMPLTRYFGRKEAAETTTGLCPMNEDPCRAHLQADIVAVDSVGGKLDRWARLRHHLFVQRLRHHRPNDRQDLHSERIQHQKDKSTMCIFVSKNIERGIQALMGDITFVFRKSYLEETPSLRTTFSRGLWA